MLLRSPDPSFGFHFCRFLVCTFQRAYGPLYTAPCRPHARLERRNNFDKQPYSPTLLSDSPRSYWIRITGFGIRDLGDHQPSFPIAGQEGEILLLSFTNEAFQTQLYLKVLPRSHKKCCSDNRMHICSAPTRLCFFDDNTFFGPFSSSVAPADPAAHVHPAQWQSLWISHQ